MPSGRKEAIIDWNLVDHLLEAGCTGTEVASRIGIHPETLYRHCKKELKIDFAVYLQQKREKGDTLLREKQMSCAMKGDKTMLVWLGKQRLGQREKMDHNVDMVNRPLQVHVLAMVDAVNLGEAVKEIDGN
jgi:hypothetical protein